MAVTRGTRFGIGLLGLAASLSLTGCFGGESNVANIDESSAPPVVTETPTPTETPTSSGSGTPVNLDCEEILTLQNVYDFNPNYAADPNAKVPASATALTDIGGRSCGWVNLTSGDTFTVTIAQPDEPTLAEAKANTAAAGEATDVYGPDSYFTSQGGVGTATVFRNGYWIVLDSSGFFEAPDAAQLAEMVISNLG